MLQICTNKSAMVKNLIFCTLKIVIISGEAIELRQFSLKKKISCSRTGDLESRRIAFVLVLAPADWSISPAEGIEIMTSYLHY